MHSNPHSLQHCQVKVGHESSFAALVHTAVVFFRALPKLRPLVLRHGLVGMITHCVRSCTLALSLQCRNVETRLVWPVWLAPGKSQFRWLSLCLSHYGFKQSVSPCLQHFYYWKWWQLQHRLYLMKKRAKKEARQNYRARGVNMVKFWRWVFRSPFYQAFQHWVSKSFFRNIIVCKGSKLRCWNRCSRQWCIRILVKQLREKTRTSARNLSIQVARSASKSSNFRPPHSRKSPHSFHFCTLKYRRRAWCCVYNCLGWKRGRV